MHELAENCRQIKFEPYLAFAEKLIHCFSDLERQLSSRTPDRHVVARKFVEAFVVSKFARFQGDLMNIYEQISLSNGRPLDTIHLKQKLDSAKRELQKKSVAGNIQTSEYTPIWGKAIDLIKKVKHLLDKYEESDQKPAVVAAIKKTISEFNPSEQMRKIPV